MKAQVACKGSKGTGSSAAAVGATSLVATVTTYEQGIIVVVGVMASGLASPYTMARLVAMRCRKQASERTRELVPSTCYRQEVHCCQYTSLVAGAVAKQSLATMAASQS